MSYIVLILAYLITILFLLIYILYNNNKNINLPLPQNPNIMYFPSNINTVNKLKEYIAPYCNALDNTKKTFAVPWQCTQRLVCQDMNIQYNILICPFAEDGAFQSYSYANDGCVKDAESDCPYYPLNVL
ncbi:ORF_54 [Catopsilia pomona nucleopolyhedrovirus]|uniref:ORF_54 n=1 Tax=Catopsilia pomona nucleopolyhedrovirus TaxID=1850906 RepID=A0A172WZD0_9ABAC|nr:ORF_54 [Catopsilia pomona nucleopolyhedrovirus]ANF29702.1 ORF_54 [Catopsilia pomona nucleopolyhedrovirus]